jgi:hypothetical protein
MNKLPKPRTATVVPEQPAATESVGEFVLLSTDDGRYVAKRLTKKYGGHDGY